ncbi:hypothetical protein [Xylophilus sp. GOD-11R]|uniref:hypothetical protein n=1 Tax=Xylophilus sp. GOD-11R TaxID=3089814 RepID=UPI00298C5219|nr:hypothetical protein [Xylophilus sp. GOD-11R]WPB57938.1 hypothetical protein R9X41_04640 [Xylophilus sp. GOD-11R]
MDARLNTPIPADAAARSRMARTMVRAVIPMMQSSTPHGAQLLLRCIAILAPQSDRRELQALVHFGLGEYVEAMQIWSGLDDPSCQALAVLCQQSLGEPSWWGAARELYENGDQAVREIIGPALGMGREVQDAAQAMRTTPDQPEVRLPAPDHRATSFNFSLRA